MNFLFRYFCVNCSIVILGSNFSLCFKLKSYINIKRPNDNGQKKNLFLGLFKFIIPFFFTDLTAKNPKSDKQIPGTNPVNQKLQYEFFHIK